MNRLESYRHTRRVDRIHARAVRLLLYVVLTVFLASLAWRIPWRTTSSALEPYAGLLNVALTATLVAVTAYYALTTAATLREMRLARAASVRPVIKIRLGHFVVRNETSSSGPLRRLESVAHIANLGRGPAIDLRVKLTAPWQREAGNEELVRSSVGDDISVIDPESRLDVPTSASVHLYQVSFPEKAFFEVNASFEDVEANYYEITQFYDLHPIRGVQVDEQEWRCHLCFEDLRLVLPTSRRHRRSGIKSSRDAEQVLIERD